MIIRSQCAPWVRIQRSAPSVPVLSCATGRPVTSFDEIKEAFREATKDQFTEGVFLIRTR